MTTYDLEDMEKLYSENPTAVKPSADYKKEEFDLLEVEHGFNDDGDYIWHFSNVTRSRPFPTNYKYVCEVIVTFFQKHIPKDVQVDVYFPPHDWEKKVLTVIGRKLGKKWNFDEDEINQELPIIGDYLTKEMLRITPRKRKL